MNRLWPSIFLLFALQASALTPQTDLAVGHYEIHIDYEITPGNPDAGWKFSISYDEDDDFSTKGGVVRLDPETTTLLATPRTMATVPNPPGVLSRFGPAGTPIWILPQNNTLGTCFLGVRTIIPTGTFQARVGSNYSPSTQGSTSLRLVSINGSGPAAGGQFATWKSEAFGSLIFSFDSTDGITAADEIPTIPIGSHTHYNWGLTKPGIYQVTFEVKGKLMPAYGGGFTTARKTLTFAVPFSSRIPNGGSLALSGALNLFPADPTSRVGYAANMAMIEATALSGASWLWTGQITTQSEPLANAVGLPLASITGGLSASEWSDITLELVSVRGPGNFSLLNQVGGVLADSVGDTIPLQAGSQLPIVAAFNQRGCYRVSFIPRGIKNGQSVQAAPVTLTFGADFTANHTYAAWQSSFEQTASIPLGSLADRMADYDQDGVSNGQEFAFFWQGMDPTITDSEKMPRAMPAADGASFKFLRDTYKDLLDESSWQIIPAFSADLTTWKPRSSRIVGFPLEIFETGYGEGNAYGRIMQRRLRAMTPVTDRAFFRFNIIQAP